MFISFAGATFMLQIKFSTKNSDQYLLVAPKLNSLLHVCGGDITSASYIGKIKAKKKMMSCVTTPVMSIPPATGQIQVCYSSDVVFIHSLTVITHVCN